VGIYAALSGETKAQVLTRFAGQGFGAFKPALVEVAVATIAPIGERMRRLLADPVEIDRVLAAAAETASAVAEPTLAEVRQIVGFWAPPGQRLP
jgi:tryptophanyl-tRNA synthetase